MIRMDFGDTLKREDFYQRVAYLRFSDEQLSAGGDAYAWGYDWHLIVRALQAGCTDGYEVANWCDVNAMPDDLPW